MARAKAKAKSHANQRPARRAQAPKRAAPRVTAAGARAVPARAAARDLLGRLSKGGVICAEGYVFELERRGYLQAGAFVPEVLFDHPEVVEQLHLDFVHAGSDVTQALTYYVHREKLRVIGREKDLVPMNRAALRIAKTVARRTGTLFAGDLCNTNIYEPGDADRSGRSSASSPSRSAGRPTPGSITSSPRPSPGAQRRSWRSRRSASTRRYPR